MISAQRLLRMVADEAPPAQLPADLWSRGRRRHRWRVTVAVSLVLVVLVSMALPLLSGWRALRVVEPADQLPSVPSTVYAALPFQSTVSQAPPGPATLLLTGPGGFDVNDLTGYGDWALVVGRSGVERWLRHANAFDAGETVLLSPDGHLVAGDGGVEGADAGDHMMTDLTAVVDLTTGQTRTYPAGAPLAWLPDGHALLTRRGNQLTMLSLDSGAVVDLGLDLGAAGPNPLALSPDGRRVVVQVDGHLHVVDIAAHTQATLAPLGGYALLAGPGAWRRDGRIAIWATQPCDQTCDRLDEVHLRLSYLDSTFGLEVDGPQFDQLTALGARLLGWQASGDAVVTVIRPAGEPAPEPDPLAPPGGRADLVALAPGGGSHELVSLPGTTNRVDVAAQLLDRFGGQPPSLSARLADWITHLSSLGVGLVVVVVLVVAAVLLRRGVGRRHRS
jgi:hypothetical protein